MIREYLKDNRRKLDNTAKIFSLEDKKNRNMFRFSIVLKEKVDPIVLNSVVIKTLDTYPMFKVKIRSGFFWNYMVPNKKVPIIEEENVLPRRFDIRENNDYLFKITYSDKKINLDFFHVLTDGSGAIEFLRSIISNYLDIRYDLERMPSKEVVCKVNYQDQYLKNYDKTISIPKEVKKVFQIPGKSNKNINNTYHYILNVADIKKICKKYNSTITEYLTAIYIYILYSAYFKNDSKKEIVISVPVNLRKYYNVFTLSNFFTCMNINVRVNENGLNIFDMILNAVHNEYERKLNFKEIRKYLYRDVKLGKNVIINLIPLFIKKFFIKYFGVFFMKGSTSTLSNVGIINIDEVYKKYIDNIFVLVIPGRIQKIKCTICSYNDKLNIIINSSINDVDFQKRFYSFLKSEIGNIKIVSNKK